MVRVVASHNAMVAVRPHGNFALTEKKRKRKQEKKRKGKKGERSEKVQGIEITVRESETKRK